MAYEGQTQAITLNRLYKLNEIFDKELAAFWIKDGSVQVYTSYSQTQPTALSDMTLSSADSFTSSGDNPKSILTEPTYFAITGTSTEVTADYLDITDTEVDLS